MLENQFIRIRHGSFATAMQQKPIACPIDGSGCCILLEPIPSGYEFSSLKIVDEDGEQIGYSYNTQYPDDYADPYAPIRILGTEAGDVLLHEEFASIEIGQMFFIEFTCTDKNGDHSTPPLKYYSQPIVRVPVDGYALVEYVCSEDALGFPFKTVDDSYGFDSAGVSMFLPIRMHSPQFSQDDKTYVKDNGEVVILYAKYYREWECVTDFLSEDMHSKIIAALSCDAVLINNKRVTKTDNYQIDWENYDLDCDGVTKLAKATFKVRENVTQRNSNY